MALGTVVGSFFALGPRRRRAGSVRDGRADGDNALIPTRELTPDRADLGRQRLQSLFPLTGLTRGRHPFPEQARQAQNHHQIDAELYQEKSRQHISPSRRP